MMATIDFDFKVLVFSFDIFDTVLTRRTARPVDVFTLLGERLREEGIRVPPFGLFRLLRTRCERWSRRFEPSHEVLLSDIHDLLGGLLLWSEAQKFRAAELERQIEASLLRITPLGLEVVRLARATGGRIAFVSDMYLEEQFLRSILIREGLFKEGDLIAVSGEWKASKTGGTIWKRLIEMLGVSPDEIFHRGDNTHSDVKSPQVAGIVAARLGTAEVSRWEEWPRHCNEVELTQQGGIAALSRLARAQCEDPDDYWTCLGAGVLGPILAGFTAWLLENSQRGNIGTLWFLSRDGWLLLESARMMARSDSPKLSYLCASRRQLQLASVDPVQGDALLEDSRCPSLRLVGSRLSIPADALRELALELDLAEDSLDEVLTPATRRRLGDALAAEAWRDRLKEWKEEASRSVRGYLSGMQKQVSGALAIVDVGWQGRSQDHLECLLPSTAGVRGYYIGYAGSARDSGSKAGWIYDHSKNVISDALHTHQRMFEVLVGGVSGPLKGYQLIDGNWQPIFAETEKGEFAPGRERAQKAALEFVRMAAHPTYSDWWSVETLHQVSRRNLDRLFFHPSNEDARQFETWTASTDDAHLDGVPLARGFDLSRILACFRKQQPWALLWLQATLKNSTRCGRVVMKAITALRDLG
jgi:FMN phosphatase YigB (HAD superfamily)